MDQVATAPSRSPKVPARCSTRARCANRALRRRAGAKGGGDLARESGGPRRSCDRPHDIRDAATAEPPHRGLGAPRCAAGRRGARSGEQLNATRRRRTARRQASDPTMSASGPAMPPVRPIDQEPVEQMAVITPTTIRRYESVCNIESAPLVEARRRCRLVHRRGETEQRTIERSLARTIAWRSVARALRASLVAASDGVARTCIRSLRRR